MLTAAYQKVVIICPAVVTGGPEAMHQLCDAITNSGGCAVMAYYDGSSAIELSETMIASRPVLPEAFVERYDHYNAPNAQLIELSPDTLVIFPETLALLAFRLHGPQRAIWWLSVDNGINHEPLFSYKQFCDGYFNDETLIHFYQSDYARSFLMEKGAKRIYPLFDYISRSFLQTAPLPLRHPRVSYFPAKGLDLARSFFTSELELPSIPIENMALQEVAAALRQTAVYIDFGHHPGKDRVPREAAVSGNVIFIHSKGAGCHFLDYPLDKFFIFTLVDIKSGELALRIRACLADPQGFYNQQQFYRRRIANEFEEFSLQVKTLFFGESGSAN